MPPVALELSDSVKQPQRRLSLRCHLNPADIVVKRRKLALVGHKKNKKANKTPNTSLKHHPFNMVRLKTQGKHIDQNACALLVPCVDVAFIKTWDGREPFGVLCIVGSIRAHQCAVEIGMTLSQDERTKEELMKATKVLAVVLKALAHSLIRRKSFEGISDHANEFRETRTKLRASEPSRLKVPILVEEKVKVHKVRFDNDDPSCHNVVDLLLLLVKSANIWSVCCEQRLLPACDFDDNGCFG